MRRTPRRSWRGSSRTAAVTTSCAKQLPSLLGLHLDRAAPLAVFHWNREKFPDPARFAAGFRAAGVRLCANIKPCLLDDHPLFEAARAEGLLISEDAHGDPVWKQFWDGLGAYLDFTNPKTQAWWREHVTADLLDLGIDATWNDNNEFEVVDPAALAAMFGAPAPAIESKPLQTLLMLRASKAAQVAHSPDRRPFLVSRAGAAGMQRYVQTWSGDNATAWESLKWNIRMGLGLALSGVSNSGHDIGGFSGPRPDAELFVRWVEAGVFMPRFSIHSWNDDGSANEPWMYANATPAVRDLIRLRYQLLPYLYDLSWRHHADFAPIVRPTFHDFDDPACLADSDDLMLGPSLLVASVVTPGAETREVYLPADAAWADYWTAERFAGGQHVTRPASLGRPPLLVRRGSAIPLNIAVQSFDRRDDKRAFAIFAPAQGRFKAACYEDDGETEAWRSGAFGHWGLEVEATLDTLIVDRPRRGPATAARARLACWCGLRISAWSRIRTGSRSSVSSCGTAGAGSSSISARVCRPAWPGCTQGPGRLPPPRPRRSGAPPRGGLRTRNPRAATRRAARGWTGRRGCRR